MIDHSRESVLQVSQAVSQFVGSLFGFDKVANSVNLGLAVAGAWRSTDPNSRRIAKLAAQVFEEQLATEYREATPNDVLAACSSVAETLDSCPSRDLLVLAARDREHLYTILLGSYARQRSNIFSEPAIELYDHLLRTACMLVERIALASSTFTPSALQALLKDSDRISSLCAELLQTQASIVQILDELRDDLSKVTTTVRLEDYQHLIRTYNAVTQSMVDKVTLPGIDLEPFASRPSLQETFVPPTVVLGGAKQRLTVDNIATGRRHAIFVSEPGGGKSTLLKHLTFRLAQGTLDLAEPQSRVPVLLKLRQYQGPLAWEALGAHVRELAGLPNVPAEWLQQLYEADRLFLIVDGLDEVPYDRQQQIGWWMENLRELRPGFRGYVASRETGLDKVDGLRAWPRLNIRPLDGLQRFDLTRFWYGAQASSGASHEADAHAIAFIAFIQGQPALWRLTENPLLCTVLCALLAPSRVGLGATASKADAYKQILRMLVHRRDDERHVPEGKKLRHEAWPLLERVAREFANYGVRSIGRGDALQLLSDELSQVNDSYIRQYRPGAMLDFLVSRTGVIREEAPGAIEFWHTTFMEYLAASHYVRSGEIEKLSRHIGDDDWREIVQWAVELGRPNEVDRIIERLLDVHDTHGTPQNKKAAVRAAWSAHRRPSSRELQGRVERLIESSFPVRDEQGEDVLFATGDARAGVIAGRLRSRELLLEEVPQLLRALGRVPTPDVLDVFDALPDTMLAAHAQILISIWLGNLSPEFGRRVIARLPPQMNVVTLEHGFLLRSVACLSPETPVHVQVSGADAPSILQMPVVNRPVSLSIGQVSWKQAVAIVRKFPGATSLTVNLLADQPDNVQISDLDAPSLTSFWLYADRAVVSFAPVRQYSDLCELTIRAYSIDFIGLDSAASRLKHLTLLLGDGGTLRSDVDITSVTSIVLDGWPHVSLVGLDHFSRLEKLSVSDAPVLESLGGLAGMVALRELTLSDCPELNEIELCASLPSLEYVRLEDCPSIDPNQYYELHDVIDVPFDMVGAWREQGLEAGIVPERWYLDDLEEAPDDEVTSRGWDDWEAVEMHDVDDWRTPEPRASVAPDPDGALLRELDQLLRDRMLVPYSLVMKAQVELSIGRRLASSGAGRLLSWAQRVLSGQNPVDRDAETCRLDCDWHVADLEEEVDEARKMTSVELETPSATTA